MVFAASCRFERGGVEILVLRIYCGINSVSAMWRKRIINNVSTITNTLQIVSRAVLQLCYLR